MKTTCLLFVLLLCSLNPASSWGALRIGALPAADSLVLYVAAEEGIFAHHGLDVSVIPFQSALEQAAAVRAGALEGYFGDIMNVLLMQESGLPQQIVATTSYSAGTDDAATGRFFGVAVAPGASHTSIEGMAGAKVAVGRATIVDYMLDCMLESRSLASDYVEHLDIRQIPVRLQMLLSGNVDAAVLPEPLLSLVEAQGARVVLDNRHLAMPLAVIALNRTQAQPETVQALQAALGEAMQRINAAPETYKALMLNKKLLPKGAAKNYAMLSFDPAYTPLPLPSANAIDHVANWMLHGKLLRSAPKPEAILP